VLISLQPLAHFRFLTFQVLMPRPYFCAHFHILLSLPSRYSLRRLCKNLHNMMKLAYPLQIFSPCKERGLGMWNMLALLGGLPEVSATSATDVNHKSCWNGLKNRNKNGTDNWLSASGSTVAHETSNPSHLQFITVITCMMSQTESVGRDEVTASDSRPFVFCR